MDLPLDNPMYVEFNRLDLSTVSVRNVLDQSHGQPTMTEEDMKLSIVLLHSALEAQMLINKKLAERLDKLENKSLNPFKK
jgi:hypothetical protein